MGKGLLITQGGGRDSVRIQEVFTFLSHLPSAMSSSTRKHCILVLKDTAPYFFMLLVTF